MMQANDLAIIEPIIEAIVQKISEEEEISVFDALEIFYHSQTYEMLINTELYLWDLSNKAIYDLFLTEKQTGDPRNSIYI